MKNTNVSRYNRVKTTCGKCGMSIVSTTRPERIYGESNDGYEYRLYRFASSVKSGRANHRCPK